MSNAIRDLLLDPATAAADTLERLSKSQLSSVVAASPALARELLGGDADDRVDAQIVLRNLEAVMGCALTAANADLFAHGITAAKEIWDIGARSAMHSMATPDFEASLWEGLAIGLYALGGLAVQHERWAELRSLTLQTPQSAGRDSWLRQGQVASTRAAQYDDSILRLAAARLRELSANATEEQSLEAVARFDLLSGLIISETDSTRFYPNAAELGEALVEPIIIDQLGRPNSPLREHVFANDDLGLRNSLRDYDAKARAQAATQRYFGRDWRWRAFEDGRTWNSIDEGHMLEEWRD